MPTGILIAGRFVSLLLLIGSLVCTAAGCIPVKQARVAAVALTLQDVGRAAAKQSDTALIREGAPAYLMLVEGLLDSYPDNKDLLIAASQAYSSYASMLPADKDKARTELLYLKAKLYGFKALSTGEVDFGKARSGNVVEFEGILDRFGKKDVPALFWTANAWVNWVGASAGGVEAMADLPALEATMRKLLELDETFNYGSPHLLMGVYLAAKPTIMGGDLSKAKQHFDRAFELGAGKILAAKVMFAEYYARGAKDRDLFVKTLNDVLAAPVGNVPELTLANAVAKEKAKALLERTDEYFDTGL